MNTKKTSYQKLSEKLGTPTFASHLKAIIITDFESQSACARKLGMSPQSLRDYLVAKRIPSPSLAGKIATKLGYPPSVFIELALTDTVKKAGYKFSVNLQSA